MAQNPAYPYDTSSISPATDIIPVTPNDSADLPGGICRSLLVATAGNIEVTTLNNMQRTFAAPVGEIHLAVSRVWAAGTTATGISAMY